MTDSYKEPDPNAFAAPSPVFQAQLVYPPTADEATGSSGDATGGLIPYKNPPALIAYYCGIFSLIPIIGIFLGPIALILGAIGLRKKRLHPEVKGSAHAWIGVVLGLLMSLTYGVILILLVVVIQG